MQPRKRIFIGLLALGTLLTTGLGAALWYFISYRPDLISTVLLVLVVGVLLFLVPVLGLGLLGLVFSLTAEKNFPGLRRLIRVTMDFLYPIALLLGRILGIDKERIESSFIAVNNRLARLKTGKIHPTEVLILLPHCLQYSECRHKITVDLDNCRRCGRCVIGEMVKIRDEIGVHVSVATGGTQARRVVQEMDPKAIVAVACERELASGIQDVGLIPVLGVLNERPNGPCLDTHVSSAAVEEIVQDFLKGRCVG